MDFYNDLDLHFNNLKNVGNWPQSLLSVKLYHADISNNELPTYTNSQGTNVWIAGDEYTWHDITNENHLTDQYLALCYAYKVAGETEGTYTIEVEAVPIANYLAEATYGDGLQTGQNGVVSIKIDPLSDKDGEGNDYLSVSDKGLKLTGLADAIENALSQSGVTWNDVKIKGAPILNNNNEVIGTNPVKSYYKVGGIDGSLTNPENVVNANQEITLKQLFDKMFNADESQPTKTEPSFSSFSIAATSTIIGGYFRVGTEIQSVTVKPSASKGSYTYGPDDTGVSWSFDITDTEYVNGALNQTGSSITVDFAPRKFGKDSNDNDIYKKYVVGYSNPIKITLKGTHSAGVKAKTNLGNDSNPNVQIAATASNSATSISNDFSIADNKILTPIYFVMSKDKKNGVVKTYNDIISELNTDTNTQIVWSDNVSTYSNINYNSTANRYEFDYTYEINAGNLDTYWLWIVTNVNYFANQQGQSIMETQCKNNDTLTLNINGVDVSGYNIYRSRLPFSVIGEHTINMGFALKHI